MPASATPISTQRAIHARRTRLRREVPGCAITEGARSSGDSEGKSEESEATAGLINNNRFAVLRPKEPAPDTKGRQEYSLDSNASFRHENPITLPLQADILPTDQPSSSEKIRNKSLAPMSPAIPSFKRLSRSRLAPHTPAKSTSKGSNQQASAPVAASISPTKPQAQPSPLVLQAETQSVRSSRPLSASARFSPDFDTAPPNLSLLTPESAPSLPSPPIPQDPLPTPLLASLPIHPSLDFKSFTSPTSCGPKPLLLSAPIATKPDIFRNDDPMRHIVRTTSGKVLCIAAEIAAANEKSTTKPVGGFLIPVPPGPAKKFGQVKEKIDRRKLDRKSAEYVGSPEEMEDGSEGEDEEGEGWLGKDEGFWKQPFEEGSFMRTKVQTWAP